MDLLFGIWQGMDPWHKEKEDVLFYTNIYFILFIPIQFFRTKDNDYKCFGI